MLECPDCRELFPHAIQLMEAARAEASQADASNQTGK